MSEGWRRLKETARTVMDENIPLLCYLQRGKQATSEVEARELDSPRSSSEQQLAPLRRHPPFQTMYDLPEPPSEYYLPRRSPPTLRATCEALLRFHWSGAWLPSVVPVQAS